MTGVALATVILFGINSCVKDNFDTPPTQTIPVGDVLTVNDLVGMATTAPFKFTEDKSFYGVITMGEKNGNLYKEAYMRDQTGGIKLSLLSSTGLNVGDSVRVYLKGARLYNDNDQVLVDSLDITENIVKISAGNKVNPVDVTIADINTGAHIGQLIRLSGVQFKNSELGKTWSDAAAQVTTNRALEDCTNETIIRTSGYANFAGDLLPEGNGTLVAIASSYRGTSQLYVGDMALVQLTGERCGAGGGGGPIDPVEFVNEQFNSALDYTDVSINGWSNILVSGDRLWQGKTFNADKYVQASGYNSGLTEMETWLITPPVTNIGTKVLSFKSGIAYWTHTTNVPLTVLISTDFVGDNFATATWTELNVTLANQNSSNYAWTESGEVDLSAYSGNAAIAFKYVGSNTESTSSLIDDVVIDIPGGGGGGGGVEPVDMIDEQFNSAVDYTDIGLTGWTNNNIIGDRKWQGKTFSTEKYAQATCYGSTAPPDMETWLITPPVTNIETKVLSLKTAKAYWAHPSRKPLTILVSENYDGSNFETATWTEISVNIASESDADNAWVESGEYALSAFSGNAAIAFKYVGSTTETTSYRLDDIKVGTSGGGGGGSATYSEAFTTTLGTYTGYSKTGDQVWEWAFYDDGCAKMSGYSGSSFANEDWLISPSYDLSDNVNTVMNVKQAAGYINDDWSQIKILISTNYSGSGDPNLATWAEVFAPNMPSGADFIFVDSGDINLGDWDGEIIHVAFKYVSTVASSSTWEISSVEIR